MSGRRRSVVVAVAAGLVLVGCANAQDPGVPPGSDAPVETSDTLGQCPPGGPDATTSPAGCIGDDGRVLRP